MIEKFKKKIEKVKLEKIQTKHINMGWYDWVNRSDIVNVLNEPPYRYTKKQLKKYIKNSNNKNTKMFAVIDIPFFWRFFENNLQKIKMFGNNTLKSHWSKAPEGLESI